MFVSSADADVTNILQLAQQASTVANPEPPPTHTHTRCAET